MSSKAEPDLLKVQSGCMEGAVDVYSPTLKLFGWSVVLAAAVSTDWSLWKNATVRIVESDMLSIKIVERYGNPTSKMLQLIVMWLVFSVSVAKIEAKPDQAEIN